MSSPAPPSGSARTPGETIAWPELCRLVTVLVDGNAHFLALGRARDGKPYEQLWAPDAPGPGAMDLSTAVVTLQRLGLADAAVLYVANLIHLPRYRTPAFIEDAALMMAAGMPVDEVLDRLAVPSTVPERAALLTMAALRGVRITRMPDVDDGNTEDGGGAER